MEATPLTLSAEERSLILDLFLVHSPKQEYRDERGRFRKRFMRNQHIRIFDKKVIRQCQENYSFQSLLEKGVIVPENTWYKFSIQAQYVSQIYNLADNGDLALVEQLATVWLLRY